MKEYLVLIIEDNPKNRKIMADLLRVHGYKYIEAEEGEKGCTLAKEKKPDLILMDIQLPVLDGYEATRRLKNDPETKDIPIVVVTSFAMRHEEERAQEAGCDDYLSKPIDIHKFIEVVKKYLPKD